MSDFDPEDPDEGPDEFVILIELAIALTAVLLLGWICI